jgi:hypothetical protein
MLRCQSRKAQANTMSTSAALRSLLGSTTRLLQDAALDLEAT